MIEAELHGKGVSVLRQQEDLLTSAVLGLLQYVPVDPFWTNLLERAKSLSGESFLARCAERGAHLSACERLEVLFWPSHQEYGEPDVLVIARAAGGPSVAFAIEAKLWAQKSGSGQHDQLNRYLRALDDVSWLAAVGHIHGQCVRPALVYLTPRTAASEVEESVEKAEPQLLAARRLFMLQWQDLYEAAREVRNELDAPWRQMLDRTAAFLERWGLRYFDGFSFLKDLPDLHKCGRFYASGSRFLGFGQVLEETVTTQDAAFYTR